MLQLLFFLGAYHLTGKRWQRLTANDSPEFTTLLLSYSCQWDVNSVKPSHAQFPLQSSDPCDFTSQFPVPCSLYIPVAYVTNSHHQTVNASNVCHCRVRKVKENFFPIATLPFCQQSPYRMEETQNGRTLTLNSYMKEKLELSYWNLGFVKAAGIILYEDYKKSYTITGR